MAWNVSISGIARVIIVMNIGSYGLIAKLRGAALKEIGMWSAVCMKSLNWATALCASNVSKGDPMSKCPDCNLEAKSDDVAIHMVDDHGWDYETARLWLREQIELQGG